MIQPSRIFTKWEVFPCQNCDHYTKIEHLTDYGALKVCKPCRAKLEAQRVRKTQRGLFGDNQESLF